MDSIETTVGQTTEINLIMLFKLMCNIYTEESFVMATTYQFIYLFIYLFIFVTITNLKKERKKGGVNIVTYILTMGTTKRYIY